MVKDWLTIVGGLAFMVVSVFVGIVSSACIIDVLDCQGFHAGTGMTTKWRWGCYVETKDGWVPKAYVFGTAKELRLKEGK